MYEADGTGSKREQTYGRTRLRDSKRIPITALRKE